MIPLTQAQISQIGEEMIRVGSILRMHPDTAAESFRKSLPPEHVGRSRAQGDIAFTILLGAINELTGKDLGGIRSSLEDFNIRTVSSGVLFESSIIYRIP